MPIVPSTCVSVGSFPQVPGVPPLSEAGMLGPDDCTAGPTPDPDIDDVLLMPVEQGNAVSQHSLAREIPQASVKPRIHLDNLSLHSPSSIVGTPIDISPRFEYPFPPVTCSPPFPSIYDFDPGASSFSALPSTVAAMSPVVSPIPISFPFPPIASVLPGRARGETRSFSPTHPRLQPRDPPIPPSLVKKRKLNKAGAAESAPSGIAATRPRGGSVHHVMPDQVRGRVDNSRQLDTDHDRSQSLDIAQHRLPTVHAKPPLSHASSSETLLPDTDAESEKVADYSLRSSPKFAPRSSIDESRTTSLPPALSFPQ
ncbi:hypothetical protein BD413DRAFT_471570 [Trametes elegans]|nr:hypothetical protein BD413DRAFT_471570 [Trametes elegans]